MSRSTRSPYLPATLLAVALSAALPLYSAPAYAAQAAGERPVNLPAGPLGRSLSLFASQRGIALSFDPALTTGLQAPALQGNVSDQEGLQRLLAGSGLQLSAHADGSYTLLKAAGDGAIAVPTLRVGGGQPGIPYQGGLALEQRYIASQAGGNGDITSLLKINPAVQYDNLAQSSFNPGEIKPAEISINGAHFYQNAFIVDGMNFNNDIDPAQEETPYRNFAVPGSSQGMALDTDLLQDIVVLDSNISAAYGGFNGGVVEASTRNPSKELSGKFSVQQSRSEWTNYHIDERTRESFEHASGWGDQPEFEKTTVRASVEGHVTENFGLLASYVGKRSVLPTYLYQENYQDTISAEKKNSELRIENWFVKGVWQASDRWNVEGSVTYAPERNRYFRSSMQGSDFEIVRDGLQANLKAFWQADWGELEQQLGWSRYDLSRDTESSDWMTWRRSTSKPWGTSPTLTLEGENGDIEQQQRTLSYKLTAGLNPVSFGKSTHQIRAGLELSRQSTHYARLDETSTYTTPRTTNTCTNSAGVTDTLTCSMGVTESGNWPGQFLTRRTRVTTGRFAYDTNSVGLWAEDDIEVGRLQVRPGLRVDKDSYMHQTTVAPRLAASFDVTGEGTTLIRAGANRYYGRNIAAWRLRDGLGQLTWRSEARNSLDEAWSVGIQSPNSVKFNELDIAYNDELMLGLAQRWQGMEFNLKLVNRKGRDQVIQVSGTTIGEPSDDPSLSNSYTTWSNEGRSEADIYSLTVSPIKSIDLAATRTTALLSLDYTDVKYASPTYFDDAEGNRYFDNPVIKYRDSFIRYSDRPVENFNRPWTARLSTITEVPSLNLTWSNFLRYRAGYTDIGDTGVNTEYQGTQVDVWDRREFGAAFTWDTRLAFDIPLAGSHAFFANIDVFNLLDKVNVYGQSSFTSANASLYYETGRSFWLELGYKF
jgi:hypothetical protein